MHSRLSLLIVINIMIGCASFAPPRATDCNLIGLICPEDARVERVTLQKLLDLPPPNQKAVVAVYEFKDMTGQRKPSDKMALFSTAVTQGAENYLIEALLNTGNGEWFVLGVGNTNQYRVDDVTVALRAVLVQTGEVLLNTTVSKTILSSGVSRDVFKFTELGTELVEVETGYTRTEAVGYSVRSAIETAVYRLIEEGLEKQFWDFDYSLLSEEEENEKSN